MSVHNTNSNTEIHTQSQTQTIIHSHTGFGSGSPYTRVTIAGAFMKRKKEKSFVEQKDEF